MRTASLSVRGARECSKRLAADYFGGAVGVPVGAVAPVGAGGGVTGGVAVLVFGAGTAALGGVAAGFSSQAARPNKAATETIPITFRLLMQDLLGGFGVNAIAGDHRGFPSPRSYDLWMFLLTRVVRFAVAPAGHTPSERGPNGYAGNPPIRGFGAHYELVVNCVGEVPPNVGYLINIKEIDQAVRTHIVPLIQSEFESGGDREPSELMPGIMSALESPLRGLLKSCRWRLSPYYSIEMSTAAMSTVILRQKFDFCAAHRLHVASLSHDENRRLFGKCNNPGGHGHNYQFEPCVAVPLDAAGRHAFHLPQLERIADDTITQRFDHKNLNSDTDEFRDGSGLNPSVENIAKVCFELLDSAIKRSGAAAQLKSMTVWESDRTSCTYPA